MEPSPTTGVSVAEAYARVRADRTRLATVEEELTGAKAEAQQAAWASELARRRRKVLDGLGSRLMRAFGRGKTALNAADEEHAARKADAARAQARLETIASERARLVAALADAARVEAAWASDMDQRRTQVSEADAAGLAKVEDALARALVLHDHLETARRLAIEARDLVGVAHGFNSSSRRLSMYDTLDDGIGGLIASSAKHRRIDSYNAAVLELRDVLRALDATPVVQAPELVDAVQLVDVHPDLRTWDIYGELIGVAQLVPDVLTWNSVRSPKSALEHVDEKLADVVASLLRRVAENDAGIAALRHQVRSYVAART